ncbi:MAG: macro domain-containing protein [Exilibacterium sp.]
MKKLPSKIYLIDANKELISAWKESFFGWDSVEVFHGDLFSIPADAMVSPANSFGYMDGGVDLAIRYELGDIVEKRVQEAILRKYHGELPVGVAEIVKTDNVKWPFLVCAPTMRVPINISHTLNAYLAFRATLLEIAKFNSGEGENINSLVCPGLGTGVGRLPPSRCAEQMKMAYFHVSHPAKIPGFKEAHDTEKKLKNT